MSSVRAALDEVRQLPKALLALVALVALAAGFIGAGVSSGTVLAANDCENNVHWGRLNCHGYFTGKVSQGGDVVIKEGLPGVSNVNQYISLMSQYLNSSNKQQSVGAAFTISVMMGQNPDQYNGSTANGVAWAKANFTRWTTILQWYESQGLIDYNYTFDSNGDPYEDSGWGITSFDNFFITNPADHATSIRFRVPPGQTGQPFLIDKSCANLQGYGGPLYEPPSNPPTGDINKPKPSTGPNDPAGYDTTTDTQVYSNCNTVSGHATDPKKPSFAVPITVTFTVGGQKFTAPATAATTGSHYWSASTPAAVRSSLSAVTVAAEGLDSANNKFTLSNSPITIGPCVLPQADCGSWSTAPTSLDPGTQFTVTASVNYSSAVVRDLVIASGAKFFVSVTGPGYSRTYNDVTPLGRSGTGIVVTTPAFGPTGYSGNYSIGWGVTGAYGAKNCGSATGLPNPPVVPVTSKPYFEVDGGDVSAGAGMSVGGNDCAVSANTKAGIVSWNRGASGSYGGAGTQYAAIALSNLQDFATGQGSGIAPTGLSFANNSDGNVNLAGGMFGGHYDGAACTPDYFANANNVQTGNVTLGAQTIANGVHKTIYVDGNVYITGNIVFSGGPYANTSQIPSFSLIVKGNIYIAPGVTQLDGFYIAQPASASDTKGVIYTCTSSAFNAAPLDRNLQNICSSPLTVNGSFIGRQVWLLRTAGTLTTTPAEKFNYVPELWLSAPFGNGLGGDAGDYNSITSLPPVL